MAFSQIAAVNGGYDEGLSTSHSVNLPSDIESGDLLLVFFGLSYVSTITFPGGWTQLFDVVYPERIRSVCYYRVADGNEGDTITVTISQSNRTSAHTSYRITGYSGVPEAGTATTALDVNPDPPSLSPSWGVLDTLWFASCSYFHPRTITAYPTNYTDGRDDRGSGIGMGIGTARRELNAVSEDPGTFTISTSTYWVANTVAIHPAVIGPFPTHFRV